MKRILIFIFLCFALALNAQKPLKKEWDIRYPQISGMTICNMMQTRNGRFLVLVGYVKQAENSPDTEGVVVVADAVTGQFLRKQTFRFGEQTLNRFTRIAEAANKDWLIVGSSGNTEKARNGWVVRVNTDLKELDSKPFGVGGDNFFEQVTQKNDGIWGFLGQSNQKNGVLLVEYKKQGTQIVPKMKRLGNILTVATDSLGQWQIAGIADKDGLWWSCLGEADKVKSAYTPEVKAADILMEQQLYFFGTSWKTGDANIWIAKFNTYNWGVPLTKNKDKLTEKIYGNKGQNTYFHAVAPTQEGHYYLVVSTTTQSSQGVAQYKIVEFDGNKLAINTPLSEDIGNSESFEIEGLTQGFNNIFWAWGDMTGKEGRTFPRVIKLQKTNPTQLFTAKSKGDDVVANLFTVTHALSDETKTPNNSLEPNENASLTLKLTNISGQNIHEISIRAKSATGGLDIGTEPDAAKFKANKTSIDFLISGKPNLIAGVAIVIFEISINGIVQQEVSISIRCGGGNVVLPRVDYTEDGLNKGNRSIISPKPDITIDLKITLPRPKADPTVTPKKPFRPKDELPVTKGDNYVDLNDETLQVYPFQLVLKLEQGDNKIIVETACEGFVKVDTLIIRYNEKPKIEEPQRLHVIAIAPQYQVNPLAYNDDDVEDFTAKMKKQEGGLYKKVLIEKYTTYSATTADTIRKIFIDLVNRCASDYKGLNKIDKRDVIVLFFSAHGKIIRERFKIVPSNFDKRFEAMAVFTSVDYENDVLNQLKRIVDTTSEEIARKIIVFIDACHSGGAQIQAQAKDFDDVNISGYVNALNSASGLMTLSSTTDSLLSYEDDAWKNGAFTEGLLEALDNKIVTLNDGRTKIQADLDKEGTKGFGYLSLNEIFIFLEKRVSDLLLRHKELYKVKQIPCLPKPDTGSKIPQLNNQLSIFKINRK